uniref:Uncharacterized protein n=1 Tax=Moniliophthora roreri TaxID=221103 RepID=A0A0W0FDP7_MONRR
MSSPIAKQPDSPTDFLYNAADILIVGFFYGMHFVLLCLTVPVLWRGNSGDIQAKRILLGLIFSMFALSTVVAGLDVAVDLLDAKMSVSPYITDIDKELYDMDVNNSPVIDNAEGLVFYFNGEKILVLILETGVVYSLVWVVGGVLSFSTLNVQETTTWSHISSMVDTAGRGIVRSQVRPASVSALERAPLTTLVTRAVTQAVYQTQSKRTEASPPASSIVKNTTPSRRSAIPGNMSQQTALSSPPSQTLTQPQAARPVPHKDHLLARRNTGKGILLRLY